MRTCATKYLSEKLSTWFVGLGKKYCLQQYFPLDELRKISNWDPQPLNLLVNALCEIGTLRKDENGKLCIVENLQKWSKEEQEITYFMYSTPILSDSDVVDIVELFCNPQIIFNGKIPAWYNLLPIEAQQEAQCYVHYHRSFLQRFYRPDVLEFTLKTGRSGLSKVVGQPVSEPFELYQSLPNLLKLMAFCFYGSNPIGNASVGKILKQNKECSVLDIGGGIGQIFDRGELANQPEIKYQLFEHRSLAENILKWRDERNLLGYLTVTGGDFFQVDTDVLFEPAQQFDFVILGWILHDWNDHCCQIILRKILRHLKPGCRLIVLEKPRSTVQNNIYHFMMHLIAGGVERTTEEYINLIKPFGLDLESQSEIFGERDILIFKRASDCSVIGK